MKFLLIICLFFFACSNSESVNFGSNPNCDSSEFTQSSAANTFSSSDSKPPTKFTIDSWEKIDFNINPNFIFGNTSFSTWPDDVIEIRRPYRDTSLVVAIPNIPLIDAIIDS